MFPFPSFVTIVIEQETQASSSAFFTFVVSTTSFEAKLLPAKATQAIALSTIFAYNLILKFIVAR